MTEAELAEIRFYVKTINELKALLRETRRNHHNTLTTYGGWACGVFTAAIDGTTDPCTCGADEWNKRIDNALNGIK